MHISVPPSSSLSNPLLPHMHTPIFLARCTDPSLHECTPTTCEGGEQMEEIEHRGMNGQEGSTRHEKKSVRVASHSASYVNYSRSLHTQSLPIHFEDSDCIVCYIIAVTMQYEHRCRSPNFSRPHGINVPSAGNASAYLACSQPNTPTCASSASNS